LYIKIKRSALILFLLFFYNILAIYFYSFLICTKKRKENEQITSETHMHTHSDIDKNHNRETRKGRRGFVDAVEPDDKSAPLGSPSSSS
jgi:hypothetical protein